MELAYISSTMLWSFLLSKKIYLDRAHVEFTSIGNEEADLTVYLDKVGTNFYKDNLRMMVAL